MTPSHRPKLSILVVDDYDPFIDMIRAMLEDYDIEISGENNAADGLSRYVESPTSLVFSDIIMPGRDGFELIRSIRFFDKKAKIIATSSRATKEIILKAVASGAERFLVKPFTKDFLINHIETSLHVCLSSYIKKDSSQIAIPEHELISERKPNDEETESALSKSIDLSDRLQRHIQSIIQENRYTIPALPTKFSTYLNLLSQGASAPELAKEMRGDIVISTNLISMANSPRFGGSKKIESLSHAMSRLGIDIIKELIIMLNGRSLYQSWEQHLKGILEDIWVHSYACGLMAKSIARHLGKNELQSEAYFSKGLYHDIGKLSIIDALRPYLEPRFDTQYLRETLSHIFNFHSRQFSFETLSRWGFPNSYLDICMYNGNLSVPEENHPFESYLITLADQLVCAMGVSEFEYQRQPDHIPILLEKLAFKGNLNQIATGVCEDIKCWLRDIIHEPAGEIQYWLENFLKDGVQFF